MTGSLVLNANPSAPLGAVTKQYVDAAVPLGSAAVPVMNGNGGCWNGDYMGHRADHVHPSDTSRLALGGGTMTGDASRWAGDPVSALNATTRQYSDTKVPLAGGNMIGLLNLKGTIAADNAPAGVVGEFSISGIFGAC